MVFNSHKPVLILKIDAVEFLGPISTQGDLKIIQIKAICLFEKKLIEKNFKNLYDISLNWFLATSSHVLWILIYLSEGRK